MRDRVLLQTQYRDKKDFLKALRTGYADGTLDPKLAEIYFGERPYEELYDVKSDPAQLNNLINDPNFATEATRHRNLLDEWLSKGDAGESREPVVELEMASDGELAKTQSMKQFEKIPMATDCLTHGKS